MKKIVLNSKDTLIHLAESNKKWFRHRARTIRGTFAIIVLFSLMVLLLVSVFNHGFIDVFALKEFTSLSSYLLGKIFSISLLLAICFLIIIEIVEIKIFLTKAIKYKKRGIRKLPIYYSCENGYTPFREDAVFSKRLPKVVPMESLSELPEEVEKNTLYFCNNIKIGSCVIEGDYFGLVVKEEDNRILWKKIIECSEIGDVEIQSIRERFMRTKVIQALITQKKDKENDIPDYYIIDWREPVRIY